MGAPIPQLEVCVTQATCGVPANQTLAACGLAVGCVWEPSLGACVSSGACIIDSTCGGTTKCNVGEGEQCDPLTGVCSCTTPCGTAGCTDPTLSKCDRHLRRSTLPGGHGPCGICVCDKTCGGGCELRPNLPDAAAQSAEPALAIKLAASVTCPGLEGLCDSNPLERSFGSDLWSGACRPSAATARNSFTCDTTTGFCVCDTSCGGPCPSGNKCDNCAPGDANCDPNIPPTATCGQCYCDTTCGGVACPSGEHCDNTPPPNQDSTCGLCIPDEQCTCTYPFVCTLR